MLIMFACSVLKDMKHVMVHYCSTSTVKLT